MLGIQNDPPVSASDGDRYLVATGSGDWDGKLARFMADPGYWQFFPVKVALNQADSLLHINTASGWQTGNPATNYRRYQRRPGRGGGADVGGIRWGVLG